jgi:pimeloyl-ACP methyl ester carboxylesterase
VKDDFQKTIDSIKKSHPEIPESSYQTIEEDLNNFAQIKTSSYDFNAVESLIDTVPFSPQKQMPVLIFAHGMGASFQDYGNILSELASHGYFVVALNFTFVNNAGYPAHEIILPSDNYKDLTHPIPIETLRKIIPTHESQKLIQTLTMNTKKANLLVNYLAVSDIAYVLQHLTLLNQTSSFLWGSMDLSKIVLIGHSGGGNYSITLAQDKELTSTYKLKGIASLDSSGCGVFEASQSAVQNSEHQWSLMDNPKSICKVGALIPFIHFHSTRMDYGSVMPFYFLIQPNDMKYVHGKNEYWVYMGPQKSFDNTPKLLEDSPIGDFPSSVYFSDHHNFTDAATLQYSTFYNNFKYFLENNSLSTPYPTDPWKVGKGSPDFSEDNTSKITENINSYLLDFLNMYLKPEEYSKNHTYDNLKKCVARENTLLFCRKSSLATD